MLLIMSLPGRLQTAAQVVFPGDCLPVTEREREKKRLCANTVTICGGSDSNLHSKLHTEQHWAISQVNSKLEAHLYKKKQYFVALCVK